MPKDTDPVVADLKPDPVVAPPVDDSAASRLRAFEDEHLGKDAPRQLGHVERGHGSLFARLPDDKKRVYAALEKAVETEQKFADARAAVAVAENEHNAACKAVDVAAEESAKVETARAEAEAAAARDAEAKAASKPAAA